MIRKAVSLAFVKQNGLYLSHVAARYRRSSFIHTLLELDDKVMHLQDGWGNTLLHYAIESDLVTVADCLLKKSDWPLLASQRNKLGKNLQQYVLQMSKEMSAKIETILDDKISNSMSEQNFIGEIKKMFKTKEVEEAKQLTEKQFKQDKPFLWFVVFISGVLFSCTGTRKIPGGYDSDWKPRLVHDKHFQWFLTYNTLAMCIYLVTTFICLSIMCLLGYWKTSKAYIKYASYPKFWKRATLVAIFLLLLASAFYMLTFAEGAAANKLRHGCLFNEDLHHKCVPTIRSSIFVIRKVFGTTSKQEKKVLIITILLMTFKFQSPSICAHEDIRTVVCFLLRTASLSGSSKDHLQVLSSSLILHTTS